MKIFGIGLSKTGTTTLGGALRLLGYNHLLGPDWESIFYWHVGDTQGLIQRAKQYDAFEDWPWSLVYREMAEAFPEAKFILTVRKDPEAWFDSSTRFRGKLGPSSLREQVYGYAMPTEENKKEHIAFYTRHTENVRAFFSDQPDRLLEVCWENGDGWPQLAAFLKLKKMPKQPFPHLNITNPKSG